MLVLRLRGGGGGWKWRWWCWVVTVMLVVMVCGPCAPPQHAPRPSSRHSRRPNPSPILPQFEETVRGWLRLTLTVDLLAYGIQEAAVLPVTPPAPPAPLSPTRYVISSPPQHPLDLLGEGGTTDSLLRREQDFFTFLKTPQGLCRKLVMVGGNRQCGEVTDDIPDGGKVVCLDPALELAPDRQPHSCLTLSFGIHVDSSFDSEIAQMNCELHMFDMLDYSPTGLLQRTPHAHFHQVGLAEERQQHFYLNVAQEVPLDNLAGILISNNLTYRPVHFLKMDIEGDEWRVLKQLTREPIMDIIGQIALEIHNEDLLNLPAEEHLPYLQKHHNVLKEVESWGFKKVAYWDNKNSKLYNDSLGASHSTCGEIHFINSNWYNPAFKTRLKNYGFKFK